MQGIFIFAIFSTIVGVLIWLIRTLVEQRRWSRLSRVQTEVHGKLLDRLGTNEELLRYIDTPAGRRIDVAQQLFIRAEAIQQLAVHLGLHARQAAPAPLFDQRANQPNQN